MTFSKFTKCSAAVLFSGLIFFTFQNFTYPLLGWDYDQRPLILAMRFAPQKDFAYVAYYANKIFTIYKIDLKNGKRSVITQYSTTPGGPQKGAGPKNMFDLSQSAAVEGLSSMQVNANPLDIPQSIQVNPYTETIYVFSVDQSGDKSEKHAYFTKVNPKTGDRTRVHLKNVPEGLELNFRNPIIGFLKDGKTAVVRVNLFWKRYGDGYGDGPGERQLPWSPIIWDRSCFHKLDLESGKFSALQKDCKNDDLGELEEHYVDHFYGPPTFTADEKTILYFSIDGLFSIDIATNKRKYALWNTADTSWIPDSSKEPFASHPYRNIQVISTLRIDADTYELIVKNRYRGARGDSEYFYDIVRVNTKKMTLAHVKKIDKIPRYMRLNSSDARHLYFSQKSQKLIFGADWKDFTIYNLESDALTRPYKN